MKPSRTLKNRSNYYSRLNNFIPRRIYTYIRQPQEKEVSWDYVTCVDGSYESLKEGFGETSSSKIKDEERVQSRQSV